MLRELIFSEYRYEMKNIEKILIQRLKKEKQRILYFLKIYFFIRESGGKEEKERES